MPASRVGTALALSRVQLKLEPSRSDDYFRAPRRDIANSGIQGQSHPLPHLDRVQAAFGPSHDLSSVQAFTNPSARAASRKLGARAYTFGDRVAFADEPTPELVAHEAAHVVQQRSGLVPVGAEGVANGGLEDHAEAVGARVASGGQVADLLPARGVGALSAARPAGPQLAPDPRGREAERAATEMWGLVNDINLLGAEVEFLYYTSAGAMTLVSFSRVKEGSGATSSTTLDQFKEMTLGFSGGVAEGSTLVTFVGETERYVRLRLRRDRSKWVNIKFSGETPTEHPSTPPEGRATPNIATAGWPVDIHSKAADIAKQLMPILTVYPGGTSDFHASVTYDDDRPIALNLLGQEYHGGKGPRFAPAEPGVQTVLTNTILAFTQGLGKRTIVFDLAGNAPSGGKDSKWRFTGAKADRGPPVPLPDEAAAIIADYRRMHAEIIAKWREGVKDAAIYAGMLGAEQLAFWMIGGVIAKGAGLVIEAAAPRLLQFVRLGSKGGARAGAEFLETMIARLPAAEKAEMQVLASKAETEGIAALTKAETNRMSSLLQRLETLLDAPLTDAEKSILRGRMGTRFMATKGGVDAAFQAAKRSYQIHHRVPLEWAHHFPGLDVNAGKNLIALETEVHRGVNAVWTRVRTGAAGKVNGSVASRTADIIDKYFNRWYDAVPPSSGSTLAAEVDVAKRAALGEIDRLISTL